MTTDIPLAEGITIKNPPDGYRSDPIVSFYGPEMSKWDCHLFGSDGTGGITYTPVEGNIPNFFIRWMMKICLGCRWERKE